MVVNRIRAEQTNKFFFGITVLFSLLRFNSHPLNQAITEGTKMNALELTKYYFSLVNRFTYGLFILLLCLNDTSTLVVQKQCNRSNKFLLFLLPSRRIFSYRFASKYFYNKLKSNSKTVTINKCLKESRLITMMIFWRRVPQGRNFNL